MSTRRASINADVRLTPFERDLSSERGTFLVVGIFAAAGGEAVRGGTAVMHMPARYFLEKLIVLKQVDHRLVRSYSGC